MSIMNGLKEGAAIPVKNPESPRLSESAGELPDDNLPIPPAIANCLAALTRDLPVLLDTHPHRWVAYVDGQQIRIADTQIELYRYCLNELGLDHEKFIVACIVPDRGGPVEYTLR